MKMKPLIVVILLFFAISIPAVSRAEYIDVVYLKNGSIIQGIIVEQIPGKSIKLKTLVGDILVFDFDQIAKFAKVERANNKKLKSPGLAFLLSFLVPGLGQHYNGQHLKGAAIEGVFVGAIVTALWVPRTIEVDELKNLFATLVMLGVSAGSMIDAPISASAINKRASESPLRTQLRISLLPFRGRDNEIGGMVVAGLSF